MYLYIHSDEMADTGRTFDRHRSMDVRHVVVPAETSVTEILRRATDELTAEERAASTPPIDLLIFNAHGSPGRIWIGESISIHNVETLGSGLGGYFKPILNGGQGIEVHCCQVASQIVRGPEPPPRTCAVRTGPTAVDLAETGVRFIYRMACSFGIRVRASFDSQIADSYGYFENSIAEATPSADADWHGHVRQLDNDPLLIRGNTGLLATEAIFGFY